jgi:ectoine hydroxylase-related dioxygenase (phytanoyl-CoA dioxygenase family)
VSNKTLNVLRNEAQVHDRDDVREVVGLFMCKSYLRPEENHTLAVPPEQARRFSPQVQRLLGYGISQPAVGFYKYKDPMQVLFGVEDEETVRL